MRDSWRLGSLTLEVHLEEGAAAPTTLRVALDPSSPLVIKPSRHAVRIIRLLWRNGLIHDRYDRTLVDAAE